MNKKRLTWWEKIEDSLIDIALDYDLTSREMMNFFLYKLASELAKHNAGENYVKELLAIIFDRYAMLKKNLTEKKGGNKINEDPETI